MLVISAVRTALIKSPAPSFEAKLFAPSTTSYVSISLDHETAEWLCQAMERVQSGEDPRVVVGRPEKRATPAELKRMVLSAISVKKLIRDGAKYSDAIIAVKESQGAKESTVERNYKLLPPEWHSDKRKRKR